MNLIDLASRIFVANPETDAGSEADPASDLIRILVFVWLMVITGLVGLSIPAFAHIAQGRYVDALVAVGTGSFLAGAATAAGSFVGFLFGVPRAGHSITQESTATSRSEYAYLPNTNLEQISDWLTKIIVGVGLVEIRAVVGWFDEIGITAGPAIWQNPGGRVIATGILVHYLLMGFFQGFLVAYLYLPKAFANARRIVAPVTSGSYDTVSSQPT
jgi:hypothetical protein